MARNIGPKQRLQRQVGEDLSLKTNALKTARRLMVRPGQHGAKGRRKVSDFGVQLKEKQKLKYLYGVMEKQLRRVYETAAENPTATGSAMLALLERRLDNTVYRLGWAGTRAAARQMVSHGHVTVNNKKMNVSSYAVKVGDVLSLSAIAAKIPATADLLKNESALPAWLERKSTVASIVRYPEREDIIEKINEQLVIEFYSR